jgi:hypothetical protein
MGLFGGKDDGLIETAVRLCWLKCKFFPTPADINEAIKDLQYEEQTKPKLQLPSRQNWYDPQAKKAFEMVAQGKAKQFLDEADIGELLEYARIHFPDISPETVRKNYPELQQGLECSNMCWNCRIDKNACLTQGWTIKHWLHKDGRIANEMAKCQKNK